MKHETSLFPGTNLLKVNVMLNFFVSVCACLGDAAWNQIAHDKSPCRPTKLKWIWKCIHADWNSIFGHKLKAAGSHPRSSSFRMQHMCGLTAKKREKCEQDSLMHLFPCFRTSPVPAVGRSGLGDYQINVCQLVWGGETNDKWLHGHSKRLDHPRRRSGSDRCSFDRHSAAMLLIKQFKRLPPKHLINFLCSFSLSPRCVCGLCVFNFFLW